MKRHIEPETLAYDALPNATQDQFGTNELIKSVKYGSGVTLSGLTCNLSMVNGTAFITNPSVDLRKYVGFKITITETTHTLVGYIKSTGTSETLSDEILDDTVFDDGAKWTILQSGWSVAGGKGVKVSDASGRNIGQAKNTTALALYKQSLTIDAISGALRPIMAAYTPAYWTTTGNKTQYVTADANGTSIYLRTSSAADTMTVDGFSVKQVLTPSATGVTIVSTRNGSTFNWTSDSGILPNAASFTAVITKE